MWEGQKIPFALGSSHMMHNKKTQINRWFFNLLYPSVFTFSSHTHQKGDCAVLLRPSAKGSSPPGELIAPQVADLRRAGASFREKQIQNFKYYILKLSR